MNHDIVTAIEESYAGSTAGTLHFGQVVGQLIQAGVEAYHVDYRGMRATYYFPDGAVHTIEMDAPALPIPEAFDPHALMMAIRGAQAGAVKYAKFKRLSQAAGCVSYTVWIAGRHVIYFGRRGESHVEKFPS